MINRCHGNEVSCTTMCILDRKRWKKKSSWTHRLLTSNPIPPPFSLPYPWVKSPNWGTTTKKNFRRIFIFSYPPPLSSQRTAKLHPLHLRMCVLWSTFAYSPSSKAFLLRSGMGIVFSPFDYKFFSCFFGNVCSCTYPLLHLVISTSLT